MHCGDCRFWYESKSQCRRNAPLPLRDGQAATDTMWPRVEAQDWCGEYQPGYIDRQGMSMQPSAAAQPGGMHLASVDARI